MQWIHRLWPLIDRKMTTKSQHNVNKYEDMQKIPLVIGWPLRAIQRGPCKGSLWELPFWNCICQQPASQAASSQPAASQSASQPAGHFAAMVWKPRNPTQPHHEIDRIQKWLTDYRLSQTMEWSYHSWFLHTLEINGNIKNVFGNFRAFNFGQGHHRPH